MKNAKAIGECEILDWLIELDFQQVEGEIDE